MEEAGADPGGEHLHTEVLDTRTSPPRGTRLRVIGGTDTAGRTKPAQKGRNLCHIFSVFRICTKSDSLAFGSGRNQ